MTTNQSLSPVELQVLEMLNCDCSIRQIAHELHYDESSISNIIIRIADRLGIDHENRRIELMVYYSSLVQY